MYRSLPLLLALAVTAFTAEISSSYALLEKQAAFQPELKTEHRDHPVHEDNAEHPVYRPEEGNRGRARIEPVKPFGPVIKHDAMLSDQPSASTEVNRLGSDVGILDNGYVPDTADVAYPDIPYAPGYPYAIGYPESNSYDYLMEPDTSTFGLLWSQMPYARTMVSAVGHTITWIFNSIFILIIGSLLTVGVCTYTNLCSIAFHGVGPIHEEMRSLMNPEKLEKIIHAADFVKSAIDKYQKIQKVNDAAGMRRRRAIFLITKNDIF